MHSRIRQHDIAHRATAIYPRKQTYLVVGTVDLQIGYRVAVADEDTAERLGFVVGTTYRLPTDIGIIAIILHRPIAIHDTALVARRIVEVQIGNQLIFAIHPLAYRIEIFQAIYLGKTDEFQPIVKIERISYRPHPVHFYDDVIIAVAAFQSDRCRSLAVVDEVSTTRLRLWGLATTEINLNGRSGFYRRRNQANGTGHADCIAEIVPPSTRSEGRRQRRSR